MFVALGLGLTLTLSLMLTTRLSLDDRGYSRTFPSSDTISTIEQTMNELLLEQLDDLSPHLRIPLTEKSACLFTSMPISLLHWETAMLEGLCYRYWLSDQYTSQYSDKNIAFYPQRYPEDYTLHTHLNASHKNSLNDS